MAPVASSAEKATDMLQKLTLETENKTNDAAEVAKKDTTITSTDRSVAPGLQNVDPNACYIPQGYAPGPIYYGHGYEQLHGWDGYMHDGSDMSSAGAYDYGYNTYSMYQPSGSPAPTTGSDVQQYSSHNYQYPQYYQMPSAGNTQYTHTQPLSSNKGPVSTASQDKPHVSLDIPKSNTVDVTSLTTNGNNGLVPQKPSQQVSSVTSNGSYSRGGPLSSGAYHDPRHPYDRSRSPVSWYSGHYNANNAVPLYSNSASWRNQNYSPAPHLMGLHNSRPTSGMSSTTPGLINRMYPNNRFYNAYPSSLGVKSTKGRWSVVDSREYRPRGRGNSFFYPSESIDGLGELNKGPRANRVKLMKPAVSPVTSGNVDDSNAGAAAIAGILDKELYNKADFNLEYQNAKFFIIKSYSEDDVHKSVKYNVWASTPNGNKKLNDAYQEAQEKGYPVFLFFSVNASGQFVGMAEMVGPVDFNKTMDYWQQDKWTGCFPVKWHIVKDVPNSILRQITLENNDNKPVTNSRDTQEVKLEQGLQVLKIFKEHDGKTSILDDFPFYETRQKVMQEKRAKQPQLQKLVVPDVKPVEAADNKESGAVKVTILKKETNLVSGEKTPSKENEAGIKNVANGDLP